MGNCVADSVPIFCASGFHSDGNGNCILSTSPLPQVCPSGLTSDGNGNCVEISVVKDLSCAEGWETDR